MKVRRPEKTRLKGRPKGVLVPYYERKTIGDMSSALVFTKVWGHKEIPTQTHPTAGLELRRSHPLLP